jgi:hypothetical protein
MDTVFRASFFASDFASFMAWRDWDFPDPGAKNCFAMAAIRTRDDAFLLGVMGTHTSNPGHIYFPSGTPDPDDIVGTRVDFDGSVWREVVEETGLSRAELDAAPGWHAVFAGPRIALIKTLAARSPAEAIKQHVLDFLAGQAQSELSGVRIVRSPADFDPRMPDFVTAFLAHIWK